jgi:hypothetical protein
VFVRCDFFVTPVSRDRGARPCRQTPPAEARELGKERHTNMVFDGCIDANQRILLRDALN